MHKPRRSEGNRVKKIFVGNFSFSTTEADLRQLFEPYGAVDSVTVITDRDTGRSRGFGFVEMPNNGEADAAITALNGKDSGGRQLTVNEARPKAAGGGGFRGGSSRGGGRDDYRGHARQPREPRW
jgi:RNA recognition motif-containing protein